MARRIHRKIAAQRRHFLHEQSTRIVRENALICVGDVNSAALARTKMAKSVLDGTLGAPRDIVLLNAGASLLIAGAVPDLSAGISRAAAALDSGAAAATLEQLTAISNAAPEAA